MTRCEWAGTADFYVAYHDNEWGVPVHDDRRLYESLVLGGAQAGLSWATILRKRENYGRAFNGFDPAVVASYTDADRARLLADAGIVRNRQKVDAAIVNAGCVCAIQDEFGSFDAFLWQFVGGKPIQNRFTTISELPSRTPLSDVVSRVLIARGFKFVGSTICYAFMQAVGMVNDHTVDCFRHDEVRRLG
jgi:DNA-3-methyladenine glycosylase I